MPYGGNDCLALTQEPILEPALPICDPHHFPVDKVSFSYPVLFNALKRFSRPCSAAERAALFHDTAVRVYRIGEQ